MTDAPRPTEVLTPQCDFNEPPDCDCPNEHWHVHNVCLDIHFEDTGEVHFHLDAGDWDADHLATGIATMDEAREAGLAWARGRIEAE